jgi:superfamily I DNA/RNA helicase
MNRSLSAEAANFAGVTVTRFAHPSADGARIGHAVPDASQRAVIDLDDAESAVVIGAPGTGKTSTAVELIADRVERRGWAPEEVLALTTSRTVATRLRDRLALRLGVATDGPLARTVTSLAFDVVTRSARANGGVAPRLITGGEQDSDISQLLAGHLDDGGGPEWPELLGPDVRALRGFRTELRELLMRATEYGVSPRRLREFGEQHDRPEWVAAADFFAEYYGVVSSSRPHQLDSSELIQFAIRALADDGGQGIERLRLVVVDDVQEFTRSDVGLLRALAARGISVVAFGDPDIAVNAFRGGEPDMVARLGELLGLPALSWLRLSTAHRQGTQLRAFTRAVTERIGTAGVVGHRAAEPSDRSPAQPIVRIEAETPAREWAAIARTLREHHVLGGIAWNEMTVVVRSGAEVPVVARALALAEVPTRSSAGSRPLRDDHAARQLLTVVDVSIARSPLTAATATALLLGPFGGLDRLTLRRLRLALRAEELAGGGTRSADDLLVEALSTRHRLVTIDSRDGRHASRLADTIAAVRESAASGGTIEELLWLAWQRSGLASVWFDQALGSGIVASEANRNLDGVLALFTAAKRFVERDPTGGAGVFLDAVLDAEIPEDTLAPQAASQSVLVTTPPGVVGLEFEIVVVAGVQDGIWPNLRLRGSLLFPQQLVRVVTGLDGVELDDRKQVLSDELRMFALAVSRARSQVVVASVANEDEAPSVFYALVPPSAPLLPSAGRTPLTLRGLTGRLRRELTSSIAGRASNSAGRDAAAGLARLAAAGVPGAAPGQWHGLSGLSTTDPLFEPTEAVPVSPSRLQAVEDSPLDWFIELIAGSKPNTAMGIGTIVHWAMETAGDSSIDSVWRGIEERWGELVFESVWVGEQQKRAARVLALGVADYLADFERSGADLVGAERRFSLTVDRAVVNGSIDRVERAQDGSVVIVDLKTGRPVTASQEIADHPQLRAYQLAYAEGVLDPFLQELGHHSPGGAKLLFVKSGLKPKLYREAVQPALGEEELEGFRERIRQAVLLMAAAEFTGPTEVAQHGGMNVERTIHRVRAVSSD